MRALGAALAAVLLGSACLGDDCELGATTGFFDEYKRVGCSTGDLSFSAAATPGTAFSFFPSERITFTNAPDDVGVVLYGAPWVGRRGSCKLFDSDQKVTADSSCEYRVLDYAPANETSAYDFLTVEIYRAYMAIYGTQGTFSGVFRVQITPEASP